MDSAQHHHHSPPKRTCGQLHRRTKIMIVVGAIATLVIVGVGIGLGVRALSQHNDIQQQYACKDGAGMTIVDSSIDANLRSTLFLLNTASQWTGGDGDTSIWLYYNATTQEDVFLFLFGDSIISKFNDANNGRVGSGASMVHSTVALMRRGGSSSPYFAAPTAPLEFFVKTYPGTNIPNTLFHPSNTSAPYYLWVIEGVSNGSMALLFGMQVMKQEGGLGFGIIGTELLVVDNVATLPPTEWTPRTISLPFSCTALQWTISAVYYGGEAGEAVKRYMTRGDTNNVPPIPSAEGTLFSNTSYVYLFGQMQPEGGVFDSSKTVVARIPFDDLARFHFDSLQYLSCTLNADDALCIDSPPICSETVGVVSTSSSSAPSAQPTSLVIPIDENSQWVQIAVSNITTSPPQFFSPPRLRVVQAPSTSESFIVYHPPTKLFVMAIVDPFSPTIRLFSSPSLLGPFCSQPVFEIPSPYGDQTNTYFSYAAKMHPELALSPSELVFSFVSNSFDFGNLFGAGSGNIYIPNFIRVTVQPNE